MAALIRPECADFLQFQDVLKKMRLLDDTIIYSLNVQLPTESFTNPAHCQNTCKELFGRLEENVRGRERALNKCIEYYGNRVSDLKVKASGENNLAALKELRKEQNKLRMLQQELGVEEILKEQTGKVLYERCRPYYSPERKI